MRTGIGHRRYVMPPFPFEITEAIDQIPWDTADFFSEAATFERSQEIEESKTLLELLSWRAGVINGLQGVVDLAKYSILERQDYAKLIRKYNETLGKINALAHSRNLCVFLLSKGLHRTILLAETVRKYIVCGVPKGISLDPFYWIEKMGLSSFIVYPQANRENSIVRIYPNVGTPLDQLKRQWLADAKANSRLDLYILLEGNKTLQQELKKNVMHYFTDEELKTLEAMVLDGTIKMKMDAFLQWQKSGADVPYQEFLKVQAVPEADTKPSSLPDGDYIFILNQQKKLYVAKKVKGVLNHSCLNHGEPVLIAGEFTIKNGKVIAITNWSGHYQNSGVRMANALTYFLEHGLDEEALESVTLERATIEKRLPSITLKAKGLPSLREWIKNRKKLALLMGTYRRLQQTSMAPQFRKKIKETGANYRYDSELMDQIDCLFSRLKVEDV